MTRSRNQICTLALQILQSLSTQPNQMQEQEQLMPQSNSIAYSTHCVECYLHIPCELVEDGRSG